MFTFPCELDHHVSLPNQLLLHLRPLHRCDQMSIRDLDSHLSPRTRYLRFFSAMPQLSESMVKLLACVDYRQRLALLAEVSTTDGTELVALGSYAAVDGRTAEIGLVVRDEWQRRGIGMALATRVLQAAEARGFDRFVAHLLHENVMARRFLNRLGGILSTKSQDGVLKVSFVGPGAR